MSIFRYEWWFKRLYPIYNRLIGRDYHALLRQLERSQFHSAAELRELQLSQLRHVIECATKTVPFYRELYGAAGITIGDIQTLDDVRKLPMVSKGDLRSRSQAFIADGTDVTKLHLHRTGGSTGEPVIFPTDQHTNAVSTADFYRALRWWGVDAGSKTVMFWGSPRFIVRTARDRLRLRALGLRHRMMNRRFFTNYNMDASAMQNAFVTMRRFRPALVRGMASSLYTFAKFALDAGLPVSKLGVRTVFSACEFLYDWERELIEKAFGCKVVNTYGLSEFGEVAFEYSCGRMHLMDENVLTELVTDEATGQKEIVVTHLKNTTTPLIRYRTGDVAEEIRNDCSCGLGLQSLHGLRGRAHDFILRPDGSIVHGQFFTHLLVFEPGLQRYQVIQESVDRFVLRLVTTIGVDQEALSRRITAGIRQTVNPNATVDVRFVDTIPVEASGKYRWIVSNVGARSHSPQT